MRLAKVVLLMLLLGILVLLGAKPAKASTSAAIGVIYFPGWISYPPAGTLYQLSQSLVPQQWHYRLPFYTSFDTSGHPYYLEDNAATVDREIAFMKAAGITYVAYDYAGWTAGTSASNGYWLYYYLLSSHKSDVNFALILADFAYIPITKQQWETVTVPRIVKLFKEPTYQKVVNGRPLVYIFGADKLVSSSVFGSVSGAKTETDFLRSASIAAGAGNPYLVSMTEPITASLGQMGFDAVSNYTAPNPGTTDHSYQTLINHNTLFWNSGASLGYPVIPIVNAGWDWRPWTEGSANYTGSPWFNQASPAEVNSNLQNAISWLGSHPANSAPNSILIYAWNEIVEGGWVVPTIYEGDARLEAIAKTVKGSYFTGPRFKGRDISGDGKIDIYDNNQLVTDFGKTLDPIANNADITGDGKVDISDYNVLLSNYGK